MYSNIDHHSCFVQLDPFRDKRADSVQVAFMDHYMTLFVPPDQLHTPWHITLSLSVVKHSNRAAKDALTTRVQRTTLWPIHLPPIVLHSHRPSSVCWKAAFVPVDWESKWAYGGGRLTKLITTRLPNRSSLMLSAECTITRWGRICLPQRWTFPRKGISFLEKKQSSSTMECNAVKCRDSDRVKMKKSSVRSVMCVNVSRSCHRCNVPRKVFSKGVEEL